MRRYAGWQHSGNHFNQRSDKRIVLTNKNKYMSTRSLIAKQLPDGKIKSIYCHSDGYPSHVGMVLKRSYNTDERIDQLIAMGWLSQLYDRISHTDHVPVCKECKHPLFPEDITMPYYLGKLRGNELRIDEFDNVNDFLCTDIWNEYKYLYINGVWHIEIEMKFVELTDEIINEEE